MLAKPLPGSLIQDYAGAPAFWAPMLAPARTFASDSGDVRDAMGNVAGIRASGCTWTNGPTGPCLAFNGASYASAAATGLDGLETFTVLFRFRTTAVATMILVEKLATTTSPFRYPFSIRLTTSGQVQALAYDGSSNPSVASAAGFNDGRWHFAAIARVKGVTLAVAIDGGARTTAADTTTTTTLNASPLGLGDRVNGGILPYTGALDDVRVYGRALSPAEVAADFGDPWQRFRTR